MTKFAERFPIYFEDEWYMRNILVNHEVYWRKKKNDLKTPEEIEKFRNYLAIHSVGKDRYEGIETELRTHEIFGPSFNNKTGFFSPGNYDTIIEKVLTEFNLDHPLEGGGNIADFLWQVYHEEDKKKSSSHMLRVVKALFGIFKHEIVSVHLPPGDKNAREYLHLKWAQGKHNCYIHFDGGAETRHHTGLFVEFGPDKIRKSVFDVDKKAYTLLCALDFSQEIIDESRRHELYLVQLLSIIRFHARVLREKELAVAPEKIMEHFHLMFEDARTPLSVEDGLDNIIKQINKK